MNNAELRFQVPLNKIARALVIILALLLIASIVVILFGYLTGHHYVYGLFPKFRFGGEQNISTYFSTVGLLIASVLLLTIFRAHRSRKLADFKYWCLLSILFLLLSIDESVSFHELLTDPSRELFGITEGLFYFAWVIPGMLFCLILAAFFLKFFLELPTRYKVLFGTSALVLISGAIGMEIVDGFFAPSTGDESTLTYDVLRAIEELLELTGIALFIYSLLDYIKSKRYKISLSLANIHIFL